MKAARDDFWNTKPAAKWNPAENYRLLNQSPWANQATWLPPQDPGRPPARVPQTDIPDVQRLPPPTAPPEPYYRTVVTWESALPVREARKTTPEAVYVTFGEWMLSTRFRPKSMAYHGNLAL